MRTRAAVAVAAGKPLQVMEVNLDDPKEGEVLIEIKATGICHTDEFTLSGADPEGLFPAILGHEGAGVVVDGGPGVTTLKKGDHVALILPTAEEFIPTFLGVSQAGAVPVPLYPPMGLGQLAGYLDHCKHIITNSRSKFVITSGQIKAVIGTVREGAPDLDAHALLIAQRVQHCHLRTWKFHFLKRLNGKIVHVLTSGGKTRMAANPLPHQRHIHMVDFCPSSRASLEKRFLEEQIVLLQIRATIQVTFRVHRHYPLPSPGLYSGEGRGKAKLLQIYFHGLGND